MLPYVVYNNYTATERVIGMRKIVEAEIIAGVRAVKSRGVNVACAGGVRQWAVGMPRVGGFTIEEFGDGRVLVDGEIVEVDEVAQAVDMSLNALM